MNLPTVAISIQQPWAWLVVNGFKDVENRTWPLPRKFVGHVLIHASKTPKFVQSGARDILEEIHSRHGLPGGIRLPEEGRECGGIVGVARLCGSVKGHHSPWANPDGWAWVVTDAKPLPFMPFKGRLGFFPVTYHQRIAAVDAGETLGVAS